MGSYYLMALGAVLLTAISQVLMKFGARSAGSIAWRIYLNPYTLTAYAILVIVTLMNLYALMRIPLKYALIFLPMTLLLVMILSLWLLQERLNRKQIYGALLVVSGLLVFCLKV